MAEASPSFDLLMTVVHMAVAGAIFVHKRTGERWHLTGMDHDCRLVLSRKGRGHPFMLNSALLGDYEVEYPER